MGFSLFYLLLLLLPVLENEDKSFDSSEEEFSFSYSSLIFTTWLKFVLKSFRFMSVYPSPTKFALFVKDMEFDFVFRPKLEVFIVLKDRCLPPGDAPANFAFMFPGEEPP